jgi:hypothetical protein
MTLMAKVDITKTELVWPGKYNDAGGRREVAKVNLPFQVIETVNESRATREVQKVKSLGLFDVYEGKEGETFEAGWRNKLIWGDNLLVVGSLLEKLSTKTPVRNKSSISASQHPWRHISRLRRPHRSKVWSLEQLGSMIGGQSEAAAWQRSQEIATPAFSVAPSRRPNTVLRPSTLMPRATIFQMKRIGQPHYQC